ncbi:MAG: hypothetical protein AAAC48_21090 [Phyllobacterium sp.]|uniref:hypothetical protein n=1 Tax=Phyllobacterium sp. TaxID=1871046 RepID=UPI0030F32B7C
MFYKTLDATRILSRAMAVAAPVVNAAQARGQGIADIELTLDIITDEEPDRFVASQSMISEGPTRFSRLQSHTSATRGLN